jgi:hypothetical protein
MIPQSEGIGDKPARFGHHTLEQRTNRFNRFEQTSSFFRQTNIVQLQLHRSHFRLTDAQTLSARHNRRFITDRLWAKRVFCSSWRLLKTSL